MQDSSSVEVPSVVGAVARPQFRISPIRQPNSVSRRIDFGSDVGRRHPPPFPVARRCVVRRPRPGRRPCIGPRSVSPMRATRRGGRRRGGSVDRHECEGRSLSSKQIATRPSRRIDFPLIVSAEVMNTRRASSPSPSTSTQTGATCGEPSSPSRRAFPSERDSPARILPPSVRRAVYPRGPQHAPARIHSGPSVPGTDPFRHDSWCHSAL